MTEYPVLDKIIKPNDVKLIPRKELPELAKEIRHFLIQNVSKTGGHLSSNLGVVELTIALHRFLNLPDDKLIFDVGHQAYVHKILTGRKDFERLRQHGGLAGFPKINESECDAFDTGHSSTALSLASGFAVARDMEGKKNRIVAVVGDGAMGGGLSMEALNNLGNLKSNIIIILNDNEMSIDRNEGGIANYLGHLRTKKLYVKFKADLEHSLDVMPAGEKIVGGLKHIKDSVKSFFVDGMFFEDLGLTYIGPIDGHSIDQVSSALKSASNVDKPVVIHVVTQKGKGYSYAEKNPGKFHGIGKFDVRTGKLIKGVENKKYTEAFSEAIVELGAKDEKIVCISASMEFGTGLNAFKEAYPIRFFDVGIAEQHAVTFSAALAASGLKPVVAIYSTFLQRAYDQILHDVCLTKQPVVFMIDRAGITGEDGETHQGIFDLSYLSHIPGLTVLAPKNCNELKKMLEYAIALNEPVAIRYPKESEGVNVRDLPVAEIEKGKAEELYKGKDVALVAVGSCVETAMELRDMLMIKDGIGVSVINARSVSPIDKDAILRAANEHRILVTLEDNVKRGGFGEAVAEILLENDCSVGFLNASLDDSFIEQGKRSELMNLHGLNTEEIYGKIRRFIG